MIYVVFHLLYNILISLQAEGIFYYAKCEAWYSINKYLFQYFLLSFLSKTKNRGRRTDAVFLGNCGSVVRWLTLCVNLLGLSNAQIASKTLFWGVSVRMFLEEISILTSKLNEKYPNVGGHYLLHWGSEWNKKAEEGWICSLFFSWDIIFCLQASALLVLDFLNSYQNSTS